MVKFDEIISGSLEWTATVLFRPFKLKKWFILAFVAFLAGAMSGGGNLNLNFRDRDYQGQKAEAKNISSQKSLQIAKITAPDSKIPSKREIKDFLKQHNYAQFVVAAIIIAVVVFAFLILLLWICSRFYFIFLEDVIENKASVVLPFVNNKKLGNSFFKFNIIFLFIWLVVMLLIIGFCLLALYKAGVFGNAASLGVWKVLSICLPFIALFVLFLIVTLVIQLIINDFTIIVMLKDKISTLKAVKKVFSILSFNKFNFILYVLIKMGLVICSSIIYSIICVVTILGLLFPAVMSVSVMYFVYKVIPQVAQPIFLISAVVVVMPILLFSWYCFLCMFLPFAVFFRTLSVKFFGRLDPKYDLFKYS